MPDYITHLFAANRVLAYGTLFFAVLSLVILLLIPFEHRELLGVNLWIKPLKFAISIMIFLSTSIYLLEPLPYTKNWLYIMSWILLGTMLIEIFCIVFQASRGQLSHFNVTDPIGSIMFPVMAVAITVAYLVYVILLIDYFRLEVELPVELVWAIRLGVVIFLFGAVTGFMMGGNLKHSVGLADGGPGLPFTNWSTVAGDLRVSHFISIHAIQVLPLLALALRAYAKPLVLKDLHMVILFAAIYFIFMLLALVQALLGKPFIRL